MYALIARDRKPLWLRLLVVLLVLFVLLASPLQVVGEAHAIAIVDDLVVAGAVAIVAVTMVAAGMIYENRDALYQAAQAVYDKYIAPVEDLAAEIAGLATSWFTGSKLSAGAYGIRLSARLYDAILGNHVADFEGNKISGAWRDYSFTLYDGANADFDAFEKDFNNKNITDFMLNGHRYTVFADALGKISKVYLSIDGESIYSDYLVDQWNTKKTINSVDFQLMNTKDSSYYFNITCDASCKGLLAEWLVWQSDKIRDFPLSLKISVPAEISYSGSIAAPAPDTLLKMPDIPKEDADGKVIYPSIPLVPEDNLIKDLPETAADKKITDLPYDKVIDVSTGAAVGEQTGTGEGTGEQTGSDAGTLDKIGTAIAGFFDSPADFTLNFDGFKNLGLKDHFPFCIPFDFANAIKVFAASAADYKLSIDLDTQYFHVHHVVDLSPFQLPIAFFRYGATIWFVVILISKTRDLIKW